MLPGLTLVISPLIALMKDQIDALQARGISAQRLDSTLSQDEHREVMGALRSGELRLLYVAPERFNNERFRDAIMRTRVSLFAVDEAHCISEWGHDFRPAYLALGALAEDLGRPTILALTATAPLLVREEITKRLGLNDPSVVVKPVARPSLRFEVNECDSEDMKRRELIQYLRRLRRPGIVYCASRREVDMVYAWLRRFGIPAHRYHAGIPAAERNAEQEHFMRGGHRTVMVATNAFGLGIDKPDIRYILHYQSPASLEQYVQEAGRGGRDGAKANCIVLPDAADRRIHEALLSRSRLRPDQLYRMGSALAAWSDEGKVPGLEALALSAEVGPRVAMALIAKIEEAGLINLENDEIHITDPSIDLEEATRALAGQFETLRTQDGRRLDALGHYFGADFCRAQFLSDYFGEDKGEACGLCDICRGSPARPASFFAAHTAPDRPKRKTGSRRGKRTGRKKKKTTKKGRVAKAPVRKSEVSQQAGGDAPGDRPASLVDNFSLSLRGEPGDQAQQAGLADPRGPQQTGGPPRRQLEIERVEHHTTAIAQSRGMQMDRGGGLEGRGSGEWGGILVRHALTLPTPA